MNSNSHPKLIVIDGGRGCNKDIVAAEVEKHFKGQNIKFFRAGRTFLDEENERLFKLESRTGPASSRLHFIGFWKALRGLLEWKILPAMRAGNHAVVIRFDSSISAHQIWGEDDHHLAMTFRLLRESMIERDARPALYIILDVDPVVGRERALLSGERGLFEDRPLEFHALVQRGFKEHVSEYNSKVVDSNRGPEFVTPEVIRHIEYLLA